MLICEIFFPLACFARAEGRRLFRVDGCFEGIKDQLSACWKRGTAEEMVHDAGQSRGAVVNQIFEVNRQNFFLIEPAEIRRKAICDIREFDICVGPAQNADIKPRVEIRQRLIIFVMDVTGFHIGDVEDM